jgi:hypothetical protein
MLVDIVTISKHRSFFVQQSETINNFEITIWFITFVWKAYWNYNTYHHIRRVWRYQRGNQNPYIEEEQTSIIIIKYIDLSYQQWNWIISWFLSAICHWENVLYLSPLDRPTTVRYAWLTKSIVHTYLHRSIGEWLHIIWIPKEENMLICCEQICVTCDTSVVFSGYSGFLCQ